MHDLSQHCTASHASLQAQRGVYLRCLNTKICDARLLQLYAEIEHEFGSVATFHPTSCVLTLGQRHDNLVSPSRQSYYDGTEYTASSWVLQAVSTCLYTHFEERISVHPLLHCYLRYNRLSRPYMFQSLMLQKLGTFDGQTAWARSFQTF